MLIVGIPLTIAYLVARPFVVGPRPWLVIVEFPLALLMGAWLLRRRARRTRHRAVAQPPTRRHAQVVLAIPDPDAQRVRATLGAWLNEGKGRTEVGRILARLAPSGHDPKGWATRIEKALPVSDARLRERALTTFLDQVEEPPRTKERTS